MDINIGEGDGGGGRGQAQGCRGPGARGGHGADVDGGDEHVATVRAHHPVVEGQACGAVATQSEQQQNLESRQRTNDQTLRTVVDRVRAASTTY